ncbi:hypothetical protein HanPI659440_Chr04g0171841 [Helianthus annuus]|nr:hypothetical protein HanPI659440_Chr04g0171841 [Helianthus annuus]
MKVLILLIGVAFVCIDIECFDVYERRSPDNDVVNKKDEDFNEDFDHVSLKQLQRMLLSREPVWPNKPAMEYVDDGGDGEGVGKMKLVGWGGAGWVDEDKDGGLYLIK